MVTCTRGSATLTFKPHDDPFIIPALPMGKLKPRRGRQQTWTFRRLNSTQEVGRQDSSLDPSYSKVHAFTHNFSWHQDATKYSLESSVFMCHKFFSSWCLGKRTLSPLVMAFSQLFLTGFQKYLATDTEINSITLLKCWKKMISAS